MNIKLGQFWKTRTGIIVKIVYVKPEICDYPYIIEGEGVVSAVNNKGENIVRGFPGFFEDFCLSEYLPWCTDFKQKKPDAPKGYRWLDYEEVIKIGDFYVNKDGSFDSVYSSIDKTIRCVIDKHWTDDWIGMIRKEEPKYRPFDGEQEFAPHRYRWLKRNGNVTGCYRLNSYCEEGVYIDNVLHTYKQMFNLGQKFEDGTPFGIAIDTP